MPAMLDDPSAPTIYRVVGDAPFPEPGAATLPESITPRQVTLRDRQTVATVVPFASRDQVPDSLLRYLCDQLNKEIELGDTYPMLEGLAYDKFANYWFQNFGAIMLLGSIDSAADVVEGPDWTRECLGFFYIKPNYPGRSSHVCNAGFVVTPASRNRGVGRLLGESYLDWAPKLGYTYSVFNLVYETNVASCKIWDGLGFKRIGRVKGCGRLRSHPGELIDAIIYGRDLGGDGPGGEDIVSEERFDKIKFYLKSGRYPNGADRAEKSRLRSAATHYKLLEGDVLMLKDKEVISDPARQDAIARAVHNTAHAGINKTTALIAERYHWSRIKETVSDVIRNCAECKELAKTPAAPAPVNGVKRSAAALDAADLDSGTPLSKRASPSPPVAVAAAAPPPVLMSTAAVAPTVAALSVPMIRSSSLPDHIHLPPFSTVSAHGYPDPDPDHLSIIAPSHTLRNLSGVALAPHHHHHSGLTSHTHGHGPMLQDPTGIPAGLRLRAGPHHAGLAAYQPIDPQIISQPSAHTHHHTLHYPFHHAGHDGDGTGGGGDVDTFQALLDAADDVEAGLHHAHAHGAHHGHHHTDAGQDGVSHRGRTVEDEEADQAAVDRDMEMLIEPQDDEDEDGDGRDGDGGRGVSKMDLHSLLSATHDRERDYAEKDGVLEKEKDAFEDIYGGTHG